MRDFRETAEVPIKELESFTEFIAQRSRALQRRRVAIRVFAAREQVVQRFGAVARVCPPPPNVQSR